jgi:LDH2 family malate/lactate/ureidoglycolate dehydrogenase
MQIDEVKKIDEWIRAFRITKPAPGTNTPLIPGDPEREAEAVRRKEGIPLIKRRKWRLRFRLAEVSQSIPACLEGA